MTDDRCDYPGCEAPAIQPSGNMQAAYCDAHRPCACGAYLIGIADFKMDDGSCDMGEGCRVHSRLACAPDFETWMRRFSVALGPRLGQGPQAEPYRAARAS